MYKTLVQVVLMHFQNLGTNQNPKPPSENPATVKLRANQNHIPELLHTKISYLPFRRSIAAKRSSQDCQLPSSVVFRMPNPAEKSRYSGLLPELSCVTSSTTKSLRHTQENAWDSSLRDLYISMFFSSSCAKLDS